MKNPFWIHDGKHKWKECPKNKYSKNYKANKSEKDKENKQQNHYIECNNELDRSFSKLELYVINIEIAKTLVAEILVTLPMKQGGWKIVVALCDMGMGKSMINNKHISKTK